MPKYINRSYKHLVSAVLLLCIIFSSLAITPNFNLNASAADTTYWNNLDTNGVYQYADFSPFTDAESSTYSIGTAAQLAALAILVNEYASDTTQKTVKDATTSKNTATCQNFSGKKIKLTENINLYDHDWVPIGLSDSKPFKGSFDGQSRTISNMRVNGNYDYAGLFGYVTADSKVTKVTEVTEATEVTELTEVTIENIIIDSSSSIYNSKETTGGICGVAYSNYGANLSIRNCINKGEINIISTKSDNNNNNNNVLAGGICGAAYTYINSGELSIINCSNTGNITVDTGTSTDTGTAYAGGICADIYNNKINKLEIINCSNTGELTAKSKSIAVAGGIYANIDDNLTIKNCFNGAAVTAKSTGTTSENNNAIAGGICADIDGVTNGQSLTITNCFNYGNISATLSEQTAVAGQIYAFGNSNAKSYEISNCYILEADTGDTGDIAGIAGNGSTQTGCTELKKDQMKAAAGTTNETDFTGSDRKTYYALVDALNAWVHKYNNTNPNPSIEALYWEVVDNDYPFFATWAGLVNVNEDNFYPYADFSPFTSSTYEIETAAQLAALAILVNEYDGDTTTQKKVKDATTSKNTATCSNFQGKTIKLIGNINLHEHDWVPIGLANVIKDYVPINIFKGSFDGQGYTISNMHVNGNYNYAGLFGYVTADSEVTIQKINIDNSSINVKSDYDTYAGGICGYAQTSSNTLTIINCNISKNITISATTTATATDAYAGGICGQAASCSTSSTSSTLDIINCSNKGTITATAKAADAYAYAGGICGYANNENKLNIKICINNGEITATATATNAYYGEICGGISGNITAGYIVYRIIAAENVYSGSDNDKITYITDENGEKLYKLSDDEMRASGAGSAIALLNDGVNSYNNTTDINALEWTNGNEGYPIQMIFNAQTANGYLLQEITFESENRDIKLPDLRPICIKDATGDKEDSNNNLAGIEWTGCGSDYDFSVACSYYDNHYYKYDADAQKKVKDSVADALESAGYKETMKITAKYTDDPYGNSSSNDIEKKYKIIEVVDNGKLYVGLYELPSSENQPGVEVKIQADSEDATDKPFSHWRSVDKNLAIEELSYRDPYYFYAYKNKTIVAEYSSDETTITPEATTNIEHIEKIGDNKVKIVSMSSVPDGYEIEWVGLIVTTQDFSNNGGWEKFKIEGTISAEKVVVLSDNDNNIRARVIKPPEGKHNVYYSSTANLPKDTKQYLYVRACMKYKYNNTTYYAYGKVFSINNDGGFKSMSEAFLVQKSEETISNEI